MNKMRKEIKFSYHWDVAESTVSSDTVDILEEYAWNRMIYGYSKKFTSGELLCSLFEKADSVYYKGWWSVEVT